MTSFRMKNFSMWPPCWQVTSYHSFIFLTNGYPASRVAGQ